MRRQPSTLEPFGRCEFTTGQRDAPAACGCAAMVRDPEHMLHRGPVAHSPWWVGHCPPASASGPRGDMPGAVYFPHQLSTSRYLARARPTPPTLAAEQGAGVSVSVTAAPTPSHPNSAAKHATLRTPTMLSQTTRHHLLQKLFWNRLGASVVQTIIRYDRKFTAVVRNYSLMDQTNGERWLLTLLEHQPVVFDIGFYDGSFTRHILHARPGAQVTGFDPSRSALRAYEESFTDEGRLAFENVGLSDAPGEVEFHDYANMCNSLVPRKDMASEAAIRYTVPITTLDSYCGDRGIERLSFIKIDAEGFDLNVLQGAHELLRRQGVDIFMFEFASGWASAKRYLWEADEYLRPLPYRLFHLFNGFLAPLVYTVELDSCCTLPAMYVGVSEARLARGGIPFRDYRF